ncbi:MAG: peptidylprolyl isomerase, partial [Leptolyngbyaceae cyanobacterium]
EFEEIVDFLKRELSFKETFHKILYKRIISEAAQQHGILVASDEVQTEANRMRREFQLEKAADTFVWLNQQGINADDWEAGIRDRLLAQKLTEHLFASEISAYFAQNKVNFDQVVLYHFVVPYASLAQELFYEIEEEEISFYEAAHLYDVDEARRLRCGYEGNFSRWHFKPDLAAKIFGAQPRAVLEPVKSEAGYDLYMIENFITAELTNEIRQRILHDLFQEWLDRELTYLLNKA